VHLVQGVRERDSLSGETIERGMALDRDVLRLENLVIKTGAKLVVIDPIVAMLGGTVDFHRDQDVRRVLKALAGMAQRRACAVVTIRHLNKDKDTKSLVYRGGGSIGFVAAVRVAMIVVKSPIVEGDRVLAVYKTNLSTPPQPMVYRFQGVPSLGVARIEWTGRTNRTLDELISSKGESK
jgi:RecA-family ATPase